MHHAALDRAGAHDRDFDDEIVEILRLEPRQHRHLRAALDLEDADGIGAACEHGVDARGLPPSRRRWRRELECRCFALAG